MKKKIREYFRKIVKENQHPIRDTWLAFLTLAGINLIIDFGLLGLIMFITDYDYPFFYTNLFHFIVANNIFLRLGLISIIGLIIYKKVKISDAYSKAFLFSFFVSLIIRMVLMVFY